MNENHKSVLTDEDVSAKDIVMMFYENNNRMGALEELRGLSSKCESLTEEKQKEWYQHYINSLI